MLYLPLAILPQWAHNALNDVLKFWYDIFGNWGVAIIFLTVTIRIVILPLTFSSVKSMQKLQVLQPEMKKIQERYKDDRQRMNQEMMKFYQENKVNPLGSCLPLLLQIPFFIGLFELLRSNSFQKEISDNPGFLFMHNLADKLTGPWLIFMIVLYVGTQLIATMITSIGGDKSQQRIMFALPFVFAVFVPTFPAGLILYWTTTNFWTIGQQLVVRKLYPKPVIAGGPGAAGNGDSKPARGKPAAPSGGDGKTKAAAKSDGANGAKAPPQSPRRKKKRSGRRR
jgi:YidC/Oxa1 family membrane protein insertase